MHCCWVVYLLDTPLVLKLIVTRCNATLVNHVMESATLGREMEGAKWLGMSGSLLPQTAVSIRWRVVAQSGPWSLTEASS